MTPSLDIGIACDLRADFVPRADAPDDFLEEYDSPATVDAIASALGELGHRPRCLGGGRRLVEALLARPPQLVFNIAEGRGGRCREAQVPALCEMLGIPCTHSDALTMALTLDKAMSKRVVAAAGVATPDFAVVAAADEAAALDLPFPLFVKPLGEGSSIGIGADSRVADRPGLLARVDRCLRDYRQPALVERYLSGVELTVGIVGAGAGARPVGVMEIAPARGQPADFVYGLEAKRNYPQEVRYHVPPRSLDARQCDAAAATALAAAAALGCRDIVRVDLRCDAAGQAHFIEANPIPGLSPVTGDIVVMNRLLGHSYASLIGAIVDAAAARYGLAAA